MYIWAQKSRIHKFRCIQVYQDECLILSRYYQVDQDTKSLLIIEKRGRVWGLPSPARPKRKSHATEGTRLHRP